MEQEHKLEITDALAAELGIENRGEQFAPEGASDFFKAVEAMESEEDPGPETSVTEHESAKPEWIHEPSGKEFETELDLLRYESGWKSNKMGELRAQVEMIDKLAAQGKGESQNQPNQLTQEQMERNLVNLALQGTGIKADEADPAYATIARMTENLIGAYDGIMEKKLAALQTKLDNFEAQTNESNAIAGAGIDRKTIENILEKHPGLKAMPINDRVAVIAALAKGAGEQPTNALRDKLRPDPASHVEGSVGSASPEEYEGNINKTFFAMSDKDQLKALGKMFEDSEMGRHIKDSHL